MLKTSHLTLALIALIYTPIVALDFSHDRKELRENFQDKIAQIDDDQNYQWLLDYVSEADNEQEISSFLRYQKSTLTAHRAYFLSNSLRCHVAIMVTVLPVIFFNTKIHSALLYGGSGMLGYSLGEMVWCIFPYDDLMVKRINSLLSIIEEE